jgi:hypothetical protein
MCYFCKILFSSKTFYLTNNFDTLNRTRTEFAFIANQTILQKTYTFFRLGQVRFQYAHKGKVSNREVGRGPGVTLVYPWTILKNHLMLKYKKLLT